MILRKRRLTITNMTLTFQFQIVCLQTWMIYAWSCLNILLCAKLKSKINSDTLRVRKRSMNMRNNSFNICTPHKKISYKPTTNFSSTNTKTNQNVNHITRKKEISNQANSSKKSIKNKRSSKNFNIWLKTFLKKVKMTKVKINQ